MKRTVNHILSIVLLLLLCGLSACASRGETEKTDDTQLVLETGETRKTNTASDEMTDETIPLSDTSTELSSAVEDICDKESSSKEELASESSGSIDETILDPSTAVSTDYSDIEMPEIDIPVGTNALGDTKEQESKDENDYHPSSGEAQQEETKLDIRESSQEDNIEDESSDVSEENSENQGADSGVDENGDTILPEVP